MTWSPATLAAIAASDDLHVSPFRADGTTYGTPTWIWSVVVGGDLLARAWNGRSSRWYRAAIEQGAGRIRAAGTEHEVAFEQADPAMHEAVDAAYRAKYAGSPYLSPMLEAGPVSATVRLLPL
ncbi:DUF2255 family protein [Rathayibacter sp. SD072]|uniref:DUF2255 family protein n=1 Tax=Rathayibacter sp. SD072 TaxID=2781731 RepID=UPI001A961082|nr:DUF2255 family protein [Rathayibacter sp. SD072]MBO0985394.1 DUF2255 family protein [Rathayibacter sp. SD072]